MSSANADRYVVLVRPQVNKQADGRWHARYPESDWAVDGDSEQEARDKLRAEYEYRMRSGEIDTTPDDDLLDRHLANPIPGVFAVDKAVYMELRSDPEALEQFLEQQANPS